MSQSTQIDRFDEAREAGMTAVQAARWVAYLDRKAERGEEPIALWEAVAQVDKVTEENQIGRVLNAIFRHLGPNPLTSELAGEGA